MRCPPGARRKEENRRSRRIIAPYQDHHGETRYEYNPFPFTFPPPPCRGGASVNPLITAIRRAQIRANAPRIAANPNPYGVEIARDIPYRDDGDPCHLLDVYGPAGAPGPLPVIVEIHGGGYLSCDKQINAQHGQYLASKGFRVVNMNYTLCPEGSLTTILSELSDAIAWVAKNADERGFDPARVFLTGDSAGGHFALLATAMFTTGYGADFFRVAPPPLPVAGCAASCPTGSFEWRLLPRNLPARLSFFLLHKYTFAKDYARRSGYEAFMDGRYPRVWLCTSPGDGLMYTHTRRMHEYMAEKGYPHVYREYTSPERRLDHAFNILHPDWPESRAANDDMIAYFREMLSK